MSEKPCIDNACGYCKFLEEEVRALKAQRDELLNVLIEVDEALYCASEWEVPIMLPERVKKVIAKAKEE